jgi:hypothetical protein
LVWPACRAARRQLRDQDHLDGRLGSARVRAKRLAGSVLDVVAQLLGLVEFLELLERAVFDLPDALARDVERSADLVECARALAADAVAQLEHAALAVAEVLERVSQRFLGENLHRALVGRLGSVVCDQAAEVGLLLVADGRLERDRRLRGALDRFNLLGSMPVSCAISSAVGWRPSPLTSLRSVRPILLSFSTT